MTTATTPIPTSLAAACAAHDRHRLDVLDALLDEAAPSAVRELFGAALDLCASLRAERDALAAQLAEVRAELAKAPKVCAIHHYEHEGPCMECGAWPPGTREWFAKIRTDLASERAHLATCRTRIAGLEQAADERSAEVARLMAQLEEARKAGWETVKAENQRAIDAEAEVARLTARVAELEARPVLTRDLAMVALSRAGSPDFVAAMATAFMAEIERHGPVTLPAQDTAAQIVRAYIAEHTKIAEQVRAGDFSWHPEMCKGLWNTEVGAAIQQAAMSRALASLGAPPTSPPAARPVFAGVSMDDLLAVFFAGWDKPADNETRSASGLRAVLARLKVTLVAPVDPEVVARAYHDDKESPVPEWPYAADYDINSPVGVDNEQARLRATSAMRTTLTAAGIPVTPEVGK